MNGVEREATDSGRAIEAEVAALHAVSFGWALACCGRNEADAADVLQQVYLKIFSGRIRFEKRSSLRTWLFGVIRITAKEHHRWSLKHWFRNQPESLESLAIAAPQGDESATDHRMLALLAASLTVLPARQREVLHLVFYQGLSIAEASEVMRVSIGTARVHYERGKQRLLDELSARGVPSR